MSIVTIVGAGMMGTALCWPLSDNGHEVRLVGTHLDEEFIREIRASRVHPKMRRTVPERVIPYSYTEIPAAVSGADVVVCAVSSFGVEWFAEHVGAYMTPEVPVLSVTKGLKDTPQGDLWVIPEYLNRLLPAEKQGKISLNAVGGPVISHELAGRRHTGTVYCGSDPEILKRLQSIFATHYYHVVISSDVIGVEVCAALKNGFALSVNLPLGEYERDGADGLAHMFNPQAALFAQSMLEMQRLIQLLGGSQNDLVVLAGAGDLYVTVFGGRTARLGRLLGKGTRYSEARQILAGETLESVEIIATVCRALPLLEARGLAKVDDFPLIRSLNTIIQQETDPELPWDLFFQNNLSN